MIIFHGRSFLMNFRMWNTFEMKDKKYLLEYFNEKFLCFFKKTQQIMPEVSHFSKKKIKLTVEYNVQYKFVLYGKFQAIVGFFDIFHFDFILKFICGMTKSNIYLAN